MPTAIHVNLWIVRWVATAVGLPYRSPESQPVLIVAWSPWWSCYPHADQRAAGPQIVGPPRRTAVALEPVRKAPNATR